METYKSLPVFVTTEDLGAEDIALITEIAVEDPSQLDERHWNVLRELNPDFFNYENEGGQA